MMYPKPKWDAEYWYRKIFNMDVQEKGLFSKIKYSALTQGFTGIIITGAPGAGKSTLAIKMLRAVYGNYRTALKCTFFKWEELRDALLEAARSGYSYPAVLWDDAGVYASRYLYRTGPRQAEEMARMIQLVRTHTHTIILTAPSITDIASFITERPGWIHIFLRRISRYTSKAKLGTYVESIFNVKPVEASRHYIVNTHIPRKYFNMYNELRRRYYLQLYEENEESKDA